MLYLWTGRLDIVKMPHLPKLMYSFNKLQSESQQNFYRNQADPKIYKRK